MTSHRWTRALTWPDRPDDWSVLRDGLVVGFVSHEKNQIAGKMEWRWAVITTPQAGTFAETMEEALEQVRKHASMKWLHKPYGLNRK